MIRPNDAARGDHGLDAHPQSYARTATCPCSRRAGAGGGQGQAAAAAQLRGRGHARHGRGPLSPLDAFALFLAGAAASVFGSLVGLGGGFVIIPVLRVFFAVGPAQAAGTSLVLVLANTAAATVGYLRDGKVDLRLGVTLTAGALPGSILGALAVHRFSPAGFDAAYGVVLVTLAVLTLRRRGVVSRPAGERNFMHRPPVGLGAGLVLGFISSLFGVGGSIVLVPLLLIAARMPPHIVTATGAFVLTTTAPVGVAAHALAGDVDWAFALPLVLGGIAGGSAGPVIARRVSSPRLITLLAGALILAACGLVLRHLV